MTKAPRQAKPPPPGEEIIATVRKECGPRTLLAFSTGKDAIAAALALRPHFDEIIPIYYYLVPGLDFVEESLNYYERNLFGGRHIYRLPHPSLYRWLGHGVFQPPHRLPVLEAANLVQFSHTDVHDIVRDHEDCPEAFCANGVRAADSPIRRIAIMRHGAIRKKQGEFLPVWDWNKERLIAAIQTAGLKLPIDYRIWGRTFDGLDARFVVPMKRHLPDDYRKIVDWFPLVEAEVFRFERMLG